MTTDPHRVAPPPASVPHEQGDIVRLAAWLVVAAIVIAGLYLGQGVLIPLAIAFLISFALNPLVGWFTRWGLSRIMSVIVVMLVVGSFFGGLGLLVGSQVRMLGAQLPIYQSTIRAKIDDLGRQMRAPGVFDGAFKTVDTVQKEVAQVVQGDAPPVLTQKVEVVAPPTSAFQTAISWLVPALAPVATAGIVLVFVFLALLDRSDLRDRLIRLLGGNLHRTTDAMEEAGTRISKYLLMQLLVNVLYAIPMALGLWLIGVPGWLLWGTLAAIMRFIPYVGPLLSAVFPIGLAFAVDPGWSMVLWTVALIVTLEAISGNILEPMLYGTSTGLSALSLIAAATFWTALWGPVGLVLSTPLTVCLLVVGRYLPQLQFLDILLGSTPVLDVPTRIYQRLIADDPDEAIDIIDDAIGQGDVAAFYNDHGIAVLRQARDDYLNNARAEHRLRVVNGLDDILEDLRGEYPAAFPPDTAPRVACIGGKWEIDGAAAQMLAHALQLNGVAAVARPAGVANARHVDKLALDGVQLVCLGYFSRNPERAARAICRRLRQRWPGLRIMLVLWDAPPELLRPEKLQALGADEVATSVSEAVGRVRRILSPDAIAETRTAPVPVNDAERVAALRASKVLDGHAREDLDALAKRAADVFHVKFAVISAIDADREFIIGQSRDLPGDLTRDGTEMIAMPRDEAICDHVVGSGQTLVVNDTERDPRFADHPAIQLWKTRFYAGAPLRTAEGLVLGALCLLDSEPRQLNPEELTLLDSMAADAIVVITGEDAPQPEAGRIPPSITVGQSVPD